MHVVVGPDHVKTRPVDGDEMKEDALAFRGIADGFPGQRMLVLAPPRVREALNSPGTFHLVVTDCGYFPHAHQHGRQRRSGIPQAVIIVCSRGQGWCATSSGHFRVKAGQVVVLPPDEPHSYGADANDPWTVWWLHVAGRDIPEFLSVANMTSAAPVRNLADPYPIVALVEETLRWMQQDSSTKTLLKASGSAWHLIALLASDRTTSDGTGDALEQAADYLRSHPSEEIGVAEIASMARLSVSHFSALFRQRFGVSVVQYRTELRMARAREMLDTTPMSISQIANSVGYPDSFYFARQFKRINGQTPRDYRQRNRDERDSGPR